MMQMRDWISGAVGAVVFLLGFLPLSGIMKLDFIGLAVIKWIAAIAGLYLMFNSIIEVTNSNVIGWFSFGIATVVFITGLFPVLHSMGIGPGFFGLEWIGRTAYNLILAIGGILLMIATFAMEL